MNHAAVRDTCGTSLYFMEYDTMRHLLGRLPSGVQGVQPSWLPFDLPTSVIPFACGSIAGVSSWALIYPLDVVKTKVQQRALSGEAYRGGFETLSRLVRGTDAMNQKPFHVGMFRLYRGLGAVYVLRIPFSASKTDYLFSLGVSAVRSVITHGVLWTLYDKIGGWIDSLPSRPEIPDTS